MEKVFNLLNEHLFGLLRNEEYLTISFSGEHSQFIRFNNALIRQTGLVDDANIGLKFIANGRTCHGAFTVSGNQNIDFQRGKDEIDRMRKESEEIPEDPYLVLPKNLGSSHEIKKSNGLHFDDSVDALIPIMGDIDFVGIWVNGQMYRGNANNLGRCTGLKQNPIVWITHWFPHPIKW